MGALLRRLIIICFCLSSCILRNCESFALRRHLPHSIAITSKSHIGARNERDRGVRAPTGLYARPTQYWEGDDVRWSRKISRRLYKSFFYSSKATPVRALIIALHCVMFLYQMVVSVNYIRLRYPKHWPNGAAEIILDSVLGSARPGPVTLDFGLMPGHVTHPQPHRYLTSGLLHGGLLHLLSSIDALRRLPSWLETGVGSLYLTIYLMSLVAGSFGAQAMAYDASSSFCLGASAGISGLYGLLMVSLSRMGNAQAFSQTARGMGVLLLYGFIFRSVSNAANVAGFLYGAAITVMCGPRYRRSYSLRRKWSVEVDPVSKDYRYAMGFGTMPSKGIVPLVALWLVVVASILSVAQLRTIPQLILEGLVHPGSISGTIRYP